MDKQEQRNGREISREYDLCRLKAREECEKQFEAIENIAAVIADVDSSPCPYRDNEQCPLFSRNARIKCGDCKRATALYNARYGKADENGNVVKLSCKIGDTVYLIYSKEQTAPISFVVNDITLQIRNGELRLFVFDSNGYGGQFGDCCKNDFTWFIGTDKSEAERRLAELRGEQ